MLHCEVFERSKIPGMFILFSIKMYTFLMYLFLSATFKCKTYHQHQVLKLNTVFQLFQLDIFIKYCNVTKYKFKSFSDKINFIIRSKIFQFYNYEYLNV